jgi:hypothetical protein
MASLEGNRKLPGTNDFAIGEQSLTHAFGVQTRSTSTIESDDAPIGLSDVAGGGAEGAVVRLCPCCGAPLGRPYIFWLPPRLRYHLPLGPNGGVLLARRVPGSEEWIEAEYFPPDDEHDDFQPVEPLLPIKHAAILLGLTVKTLYARAPFMASSVKHGNRMFFRRDLLLSADATSEAAAPSRDDILMEREARRARGEVQRAGSHHSACDHRHKGACAASRRARPSERDRIRMRRSILDDLGK